MFRFSSNARTKRKRRSANKQKNRVSLDTLFQRGDKLGLYALEEIIKSERSLSVTVVSLALFLPIMNFSLFSRAFTKALDCRTLVRRRSAFAKNPLRFSTSAQSVDFVDRLENRVSFDTLFFIRVLITERQILLCESFPDFGRIRHQNLHLFDRCIVVMPRFGNVILLDFHIRQHRNKLCGKR